MSQKKLESSVIPANHSVKVAGRDPRKIKRGDVVQVQQPDGTVPYEAVRGVKILLHLDNGVDVIVPVDVEIPVVTALTPELKAKVAALQSPL